MDHCIGLVTDTESINDLYQFTVNNCLSTDCRRTLHIVSAQFTNKLISLLSFSLFTLACIASLLASLMQLARCPPGSLRGVGRKKSQQSSFYSFALPCLQDPQAGGHLFLGFTPGSRPRVRGPAPLPLTKLGFLPGPVCGVREKTASDAVSHLALLLFLLSTVFAQTPLHQTEPDKVPLYQLDSSKQWVFESIYRHSPQCGDNPNLTFTEGFRKDLGKAKSLQECHVLSLGTGCPSLPTICTHFTDTHCSMTLCHTHSIHWSQSKGSVCPPFSASNCDIPCHDSLRGLYLPISSLSASISQSFCSSLACGASILTTPDLTPKNGSLYLPFSASNCVIWCQVVFGESPPCAHMGFYQQLYHLSVASGGSAPPIEFWSWISSTLSPDGFHPPLRSSNCMSECNFSLFTCHGVDLPSELLYLFTRKFSAISCMALSWLVFLLASF